MFELDRWRTNPALDELFTRFFDDSFLHAKGVDRWTPTSDVVETDESIAIHLDLPGLKRDDIHIELNDGNTLIIRGERKFEEQEKAKYHRVERFYGSFTRTYVLPATVQSDKIAATFKDGVLEVVLPKTESAKSRRIAIQN